MRLVFSSVTHFMYLKYDKIMHSCKILYEIIAQIKTPTNEAIRICLFSKKLDLSNDFTKTISFNPTVLLKKGAEWWKMFNLLEGRRGNYPTLHPSCESPNDAPG